MNSFFETIANFFKRLFQKPTDKPKPDPKPDPKPEPKPDPKPEPKPEPKPDPKPEPKPDPKPEPKPDPKPELGVELIWGKRANKESISAYSILILKDILASAGEKSAKITSTQRTPADQARIMYANIGSQGVAAQKRLYGRNGDKVIDVYVAEKAKGKSRSQIIDAMEDKIMEIGPSKVSRHLADPKVLQVIDIAPSSIVNDDLFVKIVERDDRVSKLLKPPTDPAFHLEIPQPIDLESGNG